MTTPVTPEAIRAVRAELRKLRKEKRANFDDHARDVELDGLISDLRGQLYRAGACP